MLRNAALRDNQLKSYKLLALIKKKKKKSFFLIGDAKINNRINEN